MAKFYVTFGQGDREKRDCYTMLEAPNLSEAIELGYLTFGNGFSMVYPNPEGAGIVARWGLTYIPLPNANLARHKPSEGAP